MKKRVWQRMISLLTAVLLVLTLIPVNAFAADRDTTRAQVRVVIENNTLSEDDGAAWSGELLDTYVNITDGMTMMSAITAALSENEMTCVGADQGYISEIEGLKEKDGNSYSGWMGTLNDWFVNEGFQNFIVEDGDLVNVVYTNGEEDTDDVGGTWSNNDTRINAMEVSEGSLNQSFSSDVTSYTLTVPAGTESVVVTPTAANKNFQVRTSVGGTFYKRTAEIPVENGTEIIVKCGDPSWPTMNTGEYSATVYTVTVAVEGADEPEVTGTGLNGIIFAGSNYDADYLYPGAMRVPFTQDITAYDIDIPGLIGQYGNTLYCKVDLEEGATAVLNYKYVLSSGVQDRTMNLTSGSWSYVNSVCSIGNWNYSQYVGYDTFSIDVTYNDVTTKYVFTPHRYMALKSLEVNPSLTYDETTGIYHAYVLPNAGAASVTVQPAYTSAAITINGESASRGAAKEITITYPEGQDSVEIPIVLSYNGVSTEYTLVIEKAPQESTPYILENPVTGKYIIDTTPDDLKVEASANGPLSYQWYKNAVESYEGAEAIEGATDSTYTPDTSEVGTVYYFCEVANGENAVHTEICFVKVFLDPTPTNVRINATTTEFPADDGFTYKETSGISYNVGDTDVETLTASFDIPEGSAGEISYMWISTGTKNGVTGGVRGFTDSYTPDTSYAFDTYYNLQVKNTYEGVSYSAYADVTPYIYVHALDVPDIEFSSALEDASYIVGNIPGTALRVSTDYVSDASEHYQWYSNTVRSTEGGSPVENATSSRFTPPMASEPGTVFYYCEVTRTRQKFEKKACTNVAEIKYLSAGEYLAANGYEIRWDGSGTAEDPYLIDDLQDLTDLSTYVAENISFIGTYFKMTADIALDDSWTPIGGGHGLGSGKYMRPFSGIFDGAGHTITYPAGTDKALFKYVREAVVKNLNIYGEYINNYGLVSDYIVDYGVDGSYNSGEGGSYAPGCPDTVDIINVTIKSGTTLSKSGFIGGYASGGNIVNITGCTVEPGVVIGFDKEAGASANNDKVGSFGGEFNGTIRNSSSAATVYGAKYVGGLIGMKGQSMGPCDVFDSSFTGSVIASDEYAGGIVGSGYNATSAPNTPCVTIVNCTSNGSISGKNTVGGMLGGEPVCQQCWENGIGTIQDNVFTGTVSASDEGAYIGGIIGFMKSLDRYNIITNNYWMTGCGADSGIGHIDAIDYTTEAFSRAEEFVVDEACIPMGEEVETLVILSQPQNTEGKVSDTVSYSVLAMNAASYQWQYSKDGQKWNKSAAAGATSNTLTVSVTTNTLNNKYRCKVTGEDGTVIFTESAYNMTADTALKITTQPASWNVAGGKDAAFIIAADNAASYQWQYSKDGQKWYKSSLESATSEMIVLKVAASNMNNLYRCKVTGTEGDVAYSHIVGIIGVPVITSQPQNVTFAAGQQAVFTVSASEDGCTYQWYYSKDGAKWYKSGASGTTTDTLSVIMKDNTKGMSLRCKVSKNGFTSTSEIAVITE